MAAGTRDRLLDAAAAVLLRDGAHALTLEAVAAQAGVSKGGLLYHFGSRQALIAGLTERLLHLIDEDVERIHTAPDGAISYFVRSSTEVQTPLDRTFVAVVRLAQGGDRQAAETIETVRARWLEALEQHVGDPTVALAITLIGDGLYDQAALRAETPDLSAAITAVDDSSMDRLVALLERLADGTAADEASAR